MTSQFHRRMLSGMLPEIILERIHESPIHGYALIIFIRSKYHVLFGPSTIFRTLKGLQADGLILSNWEMFGEHPRKLYSLTPKGEMALENFRFEMIELERITVGFMKKACS